MDKEQIFNTIVEHAKDIIPRLADHEFNESDSLRDLGANSIDRSEIIMMTLESMEANIPLIYTAKAKNIGDLATILFEKQEIVT